jgi:hypothetical protein
MAPPVSSGNNVHAHAGVGSTANFQKTEVVTVLNIVDGSC